MSTVAAVALVLQISIGETFLPHFRRIFAGALRIFSGVSGLRCYHGMAKVGTTKMQPMKCPVTVK